MPTLRTLEQVIGNEVRTRRQAAGVQQADLAHTAQVLGLPWLQATVSAVEAGQRSLSIGELGMLPQILTQAGIPVASVHEIMPDSEEPVLVAPDVTLPRRPRARGTPRSARSPAATP
jgi:transcriptional regulator with XRE-family HTH domain